MNSRSILPDLTQMRLIIDTDSFDNLLASSDTFAKRILKLRHFQDEFEFIRTPTTTTEPDLLDIIPYKEDRDASGHIKGITIKKDDELICSTAFGYKQSDMEDIAKEVLGKSTITPGEMKVIIYAFIQGMYNRLGMTTFFVTDNHILLKNRDWFENHFPGGELNIITLKESIEIMDLFLKKNKNRYSISGGVGSNKGYWYWLAFRSKIPFYNVGKPFLDALATRFKHSLKAIDEMGFQYYSKVNNDTMDDMIYHFNYFLGLVSGIFDNLALHTKDHYNITFNGDDQPRNTSLYNDTGSEFLKEVKRINSQLRDHINNYVEFTNLIRDLRNRVIHREGSEVFGFESADKWKSSFVKITNDEYQRIRQLKDSIEPYEKISIWGVYVIDPQLIVLNPYIFSKRSLFELSSFINKYLELIGDSNFIETLRLSNPRNDFITTIDRFRESALGIVSTW